MPELNETDGAKARNVAKVTIARVNQFEDLNAPTKKEGNEVFLQKTRELWKNFVVHGVFQLDKEGNSVLSNFSDLDGKVALEFFKKAGFKINIKPSAMFLPVHMFPVQ